MLNSPLIADLIFKGEVHEIKELMTQDRANSACRPSTRRCSTCTRPSIISYEDALRNADSHNDLRLKIKLHGKESQNRDSAIGHRAPEHRLTRRGQGRACYPPADSSPR